MYKLHNLKKKLKYVGKGPHKVYEIAPQRSIYVETLDGVETIGFLNGSKFKWSYNSLSQEDSCIAHDKKAAKEWVELKKVQAREEAHECQHRIQQHCEANLGLAHSYVGEVMGESFESVAPLRYLIELTSPYDEVFYNALLDTGANYNLLSYAAWC